MEWKADNATRTPAPTPAHPSAMHRINQALGPDDIPSQKTECPVLRTMRRGWAEP